MDDTSLRRFPDLIRGGNGITAAKFGGAWLIGVNLDALTITPTGAAAPVLLADTMRDLIAHDTGTALITVVDDGFYDIPGTAGPVTVNDGSF